MKIYTCATKGLWKVKHFRLHRLLPVFLKISWCAPSTGFCLPLIKFSNTQLCFFPCIGKELLMRKGIGRNWGNFAEFPSTERTQPWWLGCCFPEFAVLHADQYGFIITFYSCISPFSSSILCTWIQAYASLMSQITLISIA